MEETTNTQPAPSSSPLRPIIFGTLAVLTAILFLVRVLRPILAHEYTGIPLPLAEAAEDFELTNQYGQTVHLSDFEGRYALIFFGYTYCPDACPLTLSIWNQVYDQLGKNADDVAFIFITVDPERDTPERVKEHIDIFNSEFTGLTGSPDAIAAVADDFNVFYQIADVEVESGYFVDHSVSTYVLNPDRQVVMIFKYETPAEAIIADLKALMR